MILAGNFNVDFATNNSIPLIIFLKKEFELRINNDPRQFTTKRGTTIDAGFLICLHNVTSNTFVSYFSYHRPIVSLIPSNTNVTITEI